MAETLPAVAPDLAELGGPAGDGGVAQHQCGSIAKPLLSPRLYAGWPMPLRPTRCWSAGTQRRAQRRPRASIAAANSPTAGLRRLKPSTSHSSACW